MRWLKLPPSAAEEPAAAFPTSDMGCGSGMLAFEPNPTHRESQRVPRVPEAPLAPNVINRDGCDRRGTACPARRSR
jgi:hypothetical protein